MIIVIKKNIRVAVGGWWRYRTKGDGKMMCGDVSAQPQPGSDASGTWNKSSRNQAKAARGKKKT